MLWADIFSASLTALALGRSLCANELASSTSDTYLTVLWELSDSGHVNSLTQRRNLLKVSFLHVGEHLDVSGLAFVSGKFMVQ